MTLLKNVCFLDLWFSFFIAMEQKSWTGISFVIDGPNFVGQTRRFSRFLLPVLWFLAQPTGQKYQLSSLIAEKAGFKVSKYSSHCELKSNKLFLSHLSLYLLNDLSNFDCEPAYLQFLLFCRWLGPKYNRRYEERMVCVCATSFFQF